MEDLRVGQGVGWARRYPFPVVLYFSLSSSVGSTFELSWWLLIGSSV